MSDTLQGASAQAPNPGWVQDLVHRDAPPAGRADAWGELNALDDSHLEFSLASDIPRGLMLVLSLLPLGLGAVLAVDLVHDSMNGLETWIQLLGLASVVLSLAVGVFVMRFDLRLPKDRPVRFNRRQRKVYANRYTWNHNPFGRWGGGVTVFDWDTVHAEITRQVGASGEVATQHHSLELVSCKPGTREEVDRIRLQRGAYTTGQYEEQWELIRLYMQHGPRGIPRQDLRLQTPGFVDCLLAFMPWFAPTDAGRKIRVRMGFGYWSIALLISLMFPLWLVAGLGNFVVMRMAPEAAWPPGVEAESRR